MKIYHEVGRDFCYRNAKWNKDQNFTFHWHERIEIFRCMNYGFDILIDGVNYTDLLNGIFFMLTALGSVALIAQAIPMLFFKFDENAVEEKLVEYRKLKEQAMENELAAASETN